MLNLRPASLRAQVSNRQFLIVHAGLYTASAGLLKLAGFVLFMWMARALPVRDYATLGLLYALQTGLSTFAVAGIVESAVGLLKTHHSGHDRRALFAGSNRAFVVMVVPMSVLAMTAGLLGGIASDGGSQMIVTVVLSGVLLAFSTLQSQMERLDERHIASLAFNFLAPLGGVVGGYVAFAVSPSVSAFFLGTAAGLIAMLVALRLANVGSYGFGEGGRAARLILAGVGPFFCIAIFGWLGGYGNAYAVKWFFSATEVAGFTFLLMVSSIMQLIATAMNQVWSPRFFRILHDHSPDVVDRANRRFFGLQGIALGLAGGTMVAAFPTAVRMVGGNLLTYEFLQFELFILVSAYVLLSPWWHCYNYYVGHGQGPDAMRIILATSAAGIATWIALMWALGPLGIYVGFLVQMLMRMLAIVYLAVRRWPITIAWEGVVTGLGLVGAGYLVS